MWNAICDPQSFHRLSLTLPWEYTGEFLKEIRDELLHNFPIRKSACDLIPQLKESIWERSSRSISIPISVHPFKLPDDTIVEKIYFHICPPFIRRSKHRSSCSHISCQAGPNRATFEHAEFHCVYTKREFPIKRGGVRVQLENLLNELVSWGSFLHLLQPKCGWRLLVPKEDPREQIIQWLLLPHFVQKYK